MIIRKYPIDGLKGQEQIAYGNAVGLGNIRCRPERATASLCFCFCPFRAIGLYLIYPRRYYVTLLWLGKESVLSLF